MTDHIWYFEEPIIFSSRGYVPKPDPALDRRGNRRVLLKILARADRGEDVQPGELPRIYIPDLNHPNKVLDLPLWFSFFLHARKDMAYVMSRFDLGRTILRPIEVVLPDDAGVDTRYATLLTLNTRTTIDPDASEGVPYGHIKRPSLMCEGQDTHPGVRAVPCAADGPEIWVDPKVSSTVFVSRDLGHALQAEAFGPALNLKKVLFTP